jgi:uncharacterized protein (DUF1778 family)
MTTSTTARLNTTISAELHALLEHAAEIDGRTISDFVIATMQAAAQQTIANAEIIHLSEAGQAAFVSALLQPPPPSPALARGLARHEKLLRTK